MRADLTWRLKLNRRWQFCMNKKYINVFIAASSIVLSLTGVAKIVSASGNAGILELKDPVFGLSYRHLFYVSGVVELFIAIFCFLKIEQSIRVGAIGWLALCLATYRWAFHCLGPVHWCPCLGSLTSRLFFSPRIADLLLEGALAFMIAGSLIILVGYRYVNGSDRMLERQG